jgi:hypothetical protein
LTLGLGRSARGAEYGQSTTAIRGTHTLAHFPRRNDTNVRRCKTNRPVRVQQGLSKLAPGFSAPWTDSPVATVTLVEGGHETNVYNEGDVGPIELWALEQAIDNVRRAITWTCPPLPDANSCGSGCPTHSRGRGEHL